MAEAFSIDIEDVVELLGLERKIRTKGATSFYVKCPFCGDKGYHMNINTEKNAYRCLLCCTDSKGTTCLDLYGRVALGQPHRKGPGGNGKELYAKLCEALNIGDGSRVDYQQRRKQRPTIPQSIRCSDDNMDAVFSTVLKIKYFALSEAHKANLVKRGLSEAAITANAYRSVDEDYSWIRNHPSVVKAYQDDNLDKEKRKYERIKWFTSERLIAGLIVANVVQRTGLSVEGVPGFFKLGTHWCFRLETGMLIPTRNSEGQIVALQARTDKGNTRYLTLSAKSLPYGVEEGISRAHFPLGNAPIDGRAVVMLTEGPLKADVAVHLFKTPVAMIALQGVNNVSDLPAIFDKLKADGVKSIYNCLDMDKITNGYVAQASRVLRRIAKEHGLSMLMRCWDLPYAEKKKIELQAVCDANNISVPKCDDTYTYVARMTQALHEAKIVHSIVTLDDGTEIKNHWSDKTKGIDDYLLSAQNKTK